MQGFGGVSDVLIGSSCLLLIGAETPCRDNTSGLSPKREDVVLRDIPAKYNQLLHHATSLKALRLNYRHVVPAPTG